MSKKKSVNTDNLTMWAIVEMDDTGPVVLEWGYGIRDGINTYREIAEEAVKKGLMDRVTILFRDNLSKEAELEFYGTV